MSGRRRASARPPRGVWTLVLAASLAPGAWITLRAAGWFGGLGVNPIERLLADTGTHAMIALLVALAVTPLRQWTGLAWISALRRMLGLVAFAWVSAHLLVWVGLDLFFDWVLILDDIRHRPYVTVGFTAWVILLALALTSTRGAQRRLRRWWPRLHRLAYAAGGLAILHVLWLTRGADYIEVGIYGGVLALLLGWRLWRWLRSVPRPRAG
ncbi:sulfite oxidase heme-binding subunit YedZ [Thioalkalivibrio halophilus]|uniref:sulfite oxidase heme-binding subunit YedZ n=1 Tax=Thioalkalivibrio halophilus TaxID=252474 RepID=UPI001FCCB9FB|nr:protein-methionine-sulfoxide reductase heme-binding subunit MsrQ [Thioalkalivibrio halophilus]